MEFLRLAVVAGLLSSLAFGLKVSDTYSRLWVFTWLGLCWVVLVWQQWSKVSKSGPRRILVVGPAAVARAWQDKFPAPRGSRSVCMPLDEALSVLRQSDGDSTQDQPFTEIVLVGRLPDDADRTALILALHGRSIQVRYAIDAGSGGAPLSIPLLPPNPAWADMLKRVEDIVLSLLLLIVLSPLMTAVALAVKLTSPGPVLFRQRRIGQGGVGFDILKFRSMHVAASREVDAPQAVEHDSRLTPIGAWLRKWSVDELPQLFNVLDGSMSLVGPRPHAFPHDVTWGEKIPTYSLRYQFRPGITGLAQVQGSRGYVKDMQAMNRRLELDLLYIRTWSIWLDLKILLWTIPIICAAVLPTKTPQTTR